MVERKIYNSFAFSENEREKMQTNHSIFQELKGKHRIYRNDCVINLTDGKECNFADYDIVIGRKACYHHGEYRVYKNAPSLSMLELALICDNGNLCFGYGIRGDIISVSED